MPSFRRIWSLDLSPSRAAPRQAIGGLWDRCGARWLVFEGDGTRQAARQRAFPHTQAQPPASRRLDWVCAPGYTGRKRGEVVRRRTTLLQAHTQQWMGTCGGAGNGDYRGELGRARAAMTGDLTGQQVPLERAILRWDGQYGESALVMDLDQCGLASVLRGKDSGLLDLPAIQARLTQPPDQEGTHRCPGNVPCPLRVSRWALHPDGA